MRHVRFVFDPPERPMRVLLLLANWVGGGAERVAVHLMNRLPAAWDVRLGLLNAGDAYADELDWSRVLVAPDGERRFRYDRPNRELFTPATIASGAIHAPRAFRRMIETVRPDVVMSFLKGTAILTWLAMLGMPRRPRWIAREGNNVLTLAQYETPNPLVRAVSLSLTRMAYRSADAVLANSSDMARELVQDLRIAPQRMRMINNPVDIAAVTAAARAPLPDRPPRPFILSAGRLEHQKGHEVLIEAFARSGLAASHELVILGEGSLAPKLAAQAATLGVGTRLRLVGFCTNPHAWMARAEMFVMPSRWEGFPNAAAEALACGAPLVLTDCRFGPRDIVEPGLNGSLVPVDDPLALAAELVRLATNPLVRARYRDVGLASVRRFAVDRMVGRYANLFEQFAPASDPLSIAPSRVPARDAG